MKNLVLACVSIILLAACSSKEQPLSQTQQDLPPCTINGHGCWEVVQLLKQTKIIQNEDPADHPQEPWPHYIYTYENPALQNWGITIDKYDMFKDGGSTIYILNGGSIAVRTNRKIGSPRAQMGAVTVRFKKDPQSTNPEFDGPAFQYTPQGNLVK